MSCTKMSVYKVSFIDVLKLLHRKKKGTEDIGFLTNGGLKLHTCLGNEFNDTQQHQ